MQTPQHNVIHYDAARRRLWIAGQRCHHGATGALLAAVAATGLVASRKRSSALLHPSCGCKSALGGYFAW